MSAHPAPFVPGLSRFGDVAVSIAVELGRTELPLREVLALSEGSVVPLDRLTDELLDVTANGRVIARGEVVAQNGRFALRIVSLVGSDAPLAAAAVTPAPDRRAPADPLTVMIDAGDPA
jgi:flagellar motor switch protein FliN